jgi:hypothetical protein
MPETDFDRIVQQLKSSILNLAQATLKKYVKQATDDGNAFIDSSREKLERWTIQLAKGELKTDEFEWLVDSQKDLLAMTALKQAGLAQIRVDQFKAAVLNLVVDTVFSALKI